LTADACSAEKKTFIYYIRFEVTVKESTKNDFITVYKKISQKGFNAAK
jgi:hypothetical protein